MKDDLLDIYNSDILKELITTCKTYKEILDKLNLKDYSSNYKKLKNTILKLGLKMNRKSGPSSSDYYKHITDEQWIEAIKENKSYIAVLRSLGLKPVGGNYKTLKSKIQIYHLNIDHFTGQGWNVGENYKDFHKQIDDSEILTCPSKSCSQVVKRRLLKSGVKQYICECCGLTEWMGKPIPLELHHINGINFDNRIENLQILCPNCHSQTDNYRGKNISTIKIKNI